MIKILFLISCFFISHVCSAEVIPLPAPFCIKKAPDQFFSLKAPPSNEILVARANSVLAQGNIGLSRDQLIAAFMRIEGCSPNKHIKLPCRIEKSKKLHRFIIRDIKSKEAVIGRGCHKIVKKAIIYGPQPKIIADCVTDASARQEIVFLKRLRGNEGLVKFYGSVKRGKKYSIYLEYFQQGSLLHKLCMGESLEPHILKIAFDIAKGLQGMHQKKLVHRDLHAGNVLLEISGSYCKAVLVDFGKTLFAYRTLPANPQVPRTANPPEGLIKSFYKIDRYKADIYGLGCLFYRLAVGEHNPWSDVFNIYRLGSYSKTQRKKFYEKIVFSYQETRKKILDKILQRRRSGQAISPHEKFLILIFSMLNFHPNRRPTIEQVVATLGELQ